MEGDNFVAVKRANIKREMINFLVRLFQTARPTWLRWTGRGFWAVVDQALFAGTNFLVGVLLARWLEPAAYGAFSTAYSVFLLVGTLHTALWTEPMMIYGSGRFLENYGTYLRVLLAYHWSLGALVSAVFALLGLGLLGLGQAELGRGFLGLGVAAPLVLYLWLVRRGAYVHLEPSLAAYGGAFYLVLYLVFTLSLRRAGLLNEATAFLAMGLAGLLAAERIRLRLKAGPGRVVDPGEVRALHWGYGRWALLAGALSWVPSNIYYVVLPAFHGLEAAARFKALMNLLMPVLHFNGAIGQLLVPGMVRARAKGALGRFAGVGLAVFCTFALVYWALLVGVGREVMGWLYGGRYLEASVWLPWLGLLPLLAAVVSVTGALLRAQERPEAVALAYGIVAGFSAMVGIALVWAHSLGGAVEALLLANALSALAFWWLAKRKG